MVRQQSCSARRPGERGPRRRHHGWRGRPGNGGRGRGHRRRGCEDAGARTERESGGSPARAWWRGPFRLVLFCFVCGANWHPPASSPSSHPFTPRPRLARQCTTPWTVNDQAKGGRRPRPGYPAPIKALPDSCRTENKQKWLLSFSIHSLSYLLTDPTIPGCRPQDGLYVRDAALGGVGWMEGRRLCQPFVRLEQSGGLVGTNCSVPSLPSHVSPLTGKDQESPRNREWLWPSMWVRWWLACRRVTRQGGSRGEEERLGQSCPRFAGVSPVSSQPHREPD